MLHQEKLSRLASSFIFRVLFRLVLGFHCGANKLRLDGPCFYLLILLKLLNQLFIQSYMRHVTIVFSKHLLLLLLVLILVVLGCLVFLLLSASCRGQTFEEGGIRQYAIHAFNLDPVASYYLLTLEPIRRLFPHNLVNLSSSTFNFFVPGLLLV